MNINQKLVINIISIVDFLIATFLLFLDHVTATNPNKNTDKDYLITELITIIILLCPIFIIQIVKWLFQKFKWDMDVCLAICGSIELVTLYIYFAFSYLITIPPTEPY